MRLQTELRPAGGPRARWRTTPGTVRLADQLADRLRDDGYDVQRSQDSNDDAVPSGSPAEPGVREDVHQELDLGSSGAGAPGLSREDHARLQHQLDELLELAEDLHAVLGDERTSRISMLRVPVADGRAQLEPVFDRLLLTEQGRLQLGWEGLVHDMLRRDPELQPAWLPELRELLLLAGQDG